MGNCMSSQNIGGQFLNDHQASRQQTWQQESSSPLAQHAAANYVLLPLSTRPIEARPTKPKGPKVKLTREDLLTPEPEELYSRRTFLEHGPLPHPALPVRREILTPLTDGASGMLRHHQPAAQPTPPPIAGITESYKYKPIESIGHLHQAWHQMSPAEKSVAAVPEPAPMERMQSWAHAERMQRIKRYAPMPGAEAFEIRTDDSIFEPTPTVQYQGPNYKVGPDGKRVGFLAGGRAASIGGLGALQQLPEHDFQIKQPVLVFKAVERPKVMLPGLSEPTTAAPAASSATTSRASGSQPRFSAVPIPPAPTAATAAPAALPAAAAAAATPLLANTPLLRTSINTKVANSANEPLSAGPSTPAPSAASMSRQQAAGLSGAQAAGLGLASSGVKSSGDLYHSADNSIASPDVASPAAVVPEPTREQYDALRVFFNVQPEGGGVKMKVAHSDAERVAGAAAAGAVADVVASGIATPNLATPERSAYVVSPNSLNEESVAVVRTAQAGPAAEASPVSAPAPAMNAADPAPGSFHLSKVPEIEQSVAVVGQNAPAAAAPAPAAADPAPAAATSGPFHLSKTPETEESVAVVAKDATPTVAAEHQPATGLMGMATGMIGGMMSFIPGMGSSKHHDSPAASREASKSSKASAVAGSPAPSSPAITAIPPLQRLSLQKQQAAPARQVEDSLQSAANASARQTVVNNTVSAAIAPSAQPNIVNAGEAAASTFDAPAAAKPANTLSPYPSQAMSSVAGGGMSENEYRSEFESESIASPIAGNNMNPSDFDFTASVQVSDPAESGVPRPGVVAVPGGKTPKLNKNKSWLSRLIPGSSRSRKLHSNKEGIVPNRVKTLEAVEDRKVVESAPVVLAPPLAPLRRGSSNGQTSAAQVDEIAAAQAQANATQAPVAVV